MGDDPLSVGIGACSEADLFIPADLLLLAETGVTPQAPVLGRVLRQLSRQSVAPAQARTGRNRRPRPLEHNQPHQFAPTLLHLALGATRFRLAGLQADVVPIPPRRLRSRRTQNPEMPKPTGEGGP